jgi:hypothetical protein
MRQKILIGAILLAGTVLGGCAVGSGGYYARYGPPAPRYGVIGVAPRGGYVWTDGHWNLRRGNWYWVNGRWSRPPHPRARWVPGRWSQQGRVWRFNRGHWR